MIVCINLGCGNTDAKTGKPDMEPEVVWYNHDKDYHSWCDVVSNLEDGLPFKDESIDMLHANHVFEHVRRFPELIRECHRVLKPRGVLNMAVPMAGCRAADADPTHYQKLVPETFLHFCVDGDGMGYDTLGMRHLGFWMKWNEVIRHRRNQLDNGVPGSYLTEIIVEFEKIGPMYGWEEHLAKMAEGTSGGEAP